MNTDNRFICVTTINRGDTTYIIENAISANARETAYDKVKKLILNDAELAETRLAS